MKFCKNCGHEIRPNAKVCSNCGKPIFNNGQESNSESKLENHVEPKNETTHQQKRRNKIIGFSIPGILIVLIITYLILRSIASPMGKIDDINKAVISENPKELKKLIDTKLSTEESEAYIRYIYEEIGFDQHQKDINDLKSTINVNKSASLFENNGYELLSINKDDKKFLLFDDYSFTIPKLNVHLDESNDIEEFKYTLDGKEIVWNTNEKFQELIPGIYSFEGTGILSNEEEVEATLLIDFDYGNPLVTLTGDYYYVGLYHDYWSEDINKSIDEMKFQINGEDIKLTTEYNDKYGPLKYDEEYELTGEMNLYGNKIQMKPINFSMSEQDTENYKNDYDPYEKEVTFKVDFDEEKLENVIEEQDKKDLVESNYKYFKENPRDEVESFIYDYLYALESMYDSYDIAEVEDYIEKGSNVESILQKNIDNRAFGNMFIYDIKFSNFIEDGDIYSIDVSSKREHDDISDIGNFKTRYVVEYQKNEGKLVLKEFVDL